MKNYITASLFIVTISMVLWSCTKTDKKCDTSIKPVISIRSGLAAGDSLKMSVSGVPDVFLYTWYGPGGFSSHDSAPALPGVSGANAGRYSVDIVTREGCIYTATSDSVSVSAPSLPCSLTNNKANIASSGDMYFTYITGKPDGGSYFITGNGPEGDISLEFYGNTLPASGVYTCQGDAGFWGTGRVRIGFTTFFSSWNVTSATIYVATSNNTVTVSACSLKLYNSTFSVNSTGSFQLTKP